MLADQAALYGVLAVAEALGLELIGVRRLPADGEGGRGAPLTGERPALRVPGTDLEELRSRLRGTRWSRPWPSQGANDGWQGGTDADELSRLARYWADDYDWRAQEAAINALPGHIASLDGPCGDLWLELEDGQLTRLGPGDTVVQNGTRHAWRNLGAKPATVAVVQRGKGDFPMPRRCAVVVPSSRIRIRTGPTWIDSAPSGVSWEG